VSNVWEAPVPPPAPAHSSAMGAPVVESQPADGPSPFSDTVLAVVNGIPISRSQIVPLLIESHGLSLLEEMILLTAAKQKAAQMGLTVSDKDIAAAHEEALVRLQMPIVGNPDPSEVYLNREVGEGLLSEFLLAKNISRQDWNRRMEQRAYLHAIARAQIENEQITEAELKKEYELAYGERIQVRHIQLTSMAAVDRVTAQFQQNKDFELLARQMSENGITSVNGGLLPPFTRHDPAVTPMFARMAFDLQEGQISPVFQEGSWYHIVKLERRFPASSVGFENVDHEKLRSRLIARRVAERQDQLERELFEAASVSIRDPMLSRQFRAKHRRAER
jgi:parvulin-like peptidyl-prolyl isomerase